MLAATCAALSLLLLAVPTASAQEAEVVAEGLNGPQDVIVASDGALWVIDSGVGGDQPIEVFDGESGEFVEAGLGATARVVRVDPASGESTDIALLPSFASESGATGGGGLVIHDGQVFAAVGEWIAANPSDRPEGIGAIWSVSESGEAAVVVDTFAHEAANDPYPFGPPTSHPYGMHSAAGTLLVADAGANALLSVDAATGEASLLAIFEPLPGVFPRPDYDDELLTDPVPTGVTVGSDGATYVSLLSGAPFVPGNAKVIAVGTDGSLSDHATGLTMLTDLVTGPDGEMYATQFAIFGEEGPVPASGAVVRVKPGEGSEIVIDGLEFVTAVAFDGDGNAYVAVNGVGPPGSGQILKYAGIASTGGQDLPQTGSTTRLPVVIAVAVVAAGVLLLRARDDLGRL